MSTEELKLLGVLNAILGQDAARAHIDPIASQVEKELSHNPAALMAWQPIPLSIFGSALPADIRSSWLFILRAGATTGAERHPNSHQRVMSYRGSGDLQTLVDGKWRSNELVSDPQVNFLKRWVSIPLNVWHQAVVPERNWVVVSFHTVLTNELIEERPNGNATRQRLYVTKQEPMTCPHQRHQCLN
jgi:hypothetical protein